MNKYKLEKAQAWVEAGKQIGKSQFLLKGQHSYYVAAAVQKWRGIYKVSICEIEETQMAGEVFERDEELDFESFEQVIAFFQNSSLILFSELKPLKGQKLFNPEF
ncbi:hypothetical protein [Hymenobacter gelipurpurascens]|uniref:hypothetical protein n=1 Tax=Hymenobacter gelipurpurascens TaxID=89968 RepID=UPI001130620C|nr:hypothetical protein [Hymenobacter gelipurpurascens]